jgi:hypothetical protein
MGSGSGWSSVVRGRPYMNTREESRSLQVILRRASQLGNRGRDIAKSQVWCIRPRYQDLQKGNLETERVIFGAEGTSACLKITETFSYMKGAVLNPQRGKHGACVGQRLALVGTEVHGRAKIRPRLRPFRGPVFS